MPRKTVVTYHRTYLENILDAKGFNKQGRKEILSKLWSVSTGMCASILNGRREVSGTRYDTRAKLSILAEYFSLDLNELDRLENQHLAEKDVLRIEKEKSLSPVECIERKLHTCNNHNYNSSVNETVCP